MAIWTAPWAFWVQFLPYFFPPINKNYFCTFFYLFFIFISFNLNKKLDSFIFIFNYHNLNRIKFSHVKSSRRGEYTIEKGFGWVRVFFWTITLNVNKVCVLTTVYFHIKICNTWSKINISYWRCGHSRAFVLFRAKKDKFIVCHEDLFIAFLHLLSQTP